jgi:hypothetical protein
MGGSNDPSNLTKPITVEQHAEEHRLLYATHGKIEDFIAWKALSGQISMTEASKLSLKEGQRKAGLSLSKSNLKRKNKSYEDIYGSKGNEIKEKIRKSSLIREWSISDEERENRRKRAKENNPGKTSDKQVADKISKTASKGMTLFNPKTNETKVVDGLNRWAKENDLNLAYVKTRFRRNQDVLGWFRIISKV